MKYVSIKLIIFTSILILLIVLYSSLSHSQDNTPILYNNFNILLPKINHNNTVHNIQALLKYNIITNTWSLDSLIYTPTSNIKNWGYDQDIFIQEINKYRKNGAPCTTATNLSSITWDENLALASVDHSADMAINNYFSHYGLDDSSPWSRISRTNYRGYLHGENIGAGYYNVLEAIKGWIDSPGHCMNIMSTQVNVMGCGWAATPNSDYKFYHTMLTGYRSK